MVTFLRDKLAALHQCVDNQEHMASQHEEDEVEDKDERPAVRRHLRSFRGFVTYMLPDYVPQLDPSGQAPCSIAPALLDHSLEEERPS